VTTCSAFCFCPVSHSSRNFTVGEKTPDAPASSVYLTFSAPAASRIFPA
jgi:hypothetical protein